jgi:hypothetical protein
MQRFDPRVTAGDIEAAVAQFKETNGVVPQFIGLNPKSANLPVLEGVEVKLIGGCCQWEAWLSAADPNNSMSPRPSTLLEPLNGTSCVVKPSDPRKYPPDNYVHSKQPKQQPKVDTIIPTITRRGPRSHDLPDEKIRELALEGMGSKAIAARLEHGGVKVSYRTIQRRLKGKKPIIHIGV